MRREVLLLIAKQFLKGLSARALYPLVGIMVVLLFYAAYSGISYHDQNHYREAHQDMARESWEGNPDKHPHRMAHFGTFAFRLKHPLSIFDFGIESYTGNAVFLEAHRQNMVNFSEAGFSTGLLRFGELNMAMLLQIILPLIVFFIGYASLVADRENGTLKMLLTQGANWQELLFGRSLGLLAISFLFLLPFLALTIVLIVAEGHATAGVWGRLLILGLSYMAYAYILCLVTIGISVSSRSSKSALIKLLGLWLVLVVLVPRTAQAVGGYLHPTPTKLAFRAAIEEEVIQYGDSHDPNDPHFKALKDSVLRVHNVSDVSELPFNYGGFVMAQGEEISAVIYRKHQARLIDQYRSQNQLTRVLSIVNPYLAIKNLSMALCGTDFEAYVDFQNQAEDYRYQLAQTMNELQMKYISPKRVSGSEGKVHVVSREEWEAFPDFEHQFLPLGAALQHELLSVFSLVLWLVFSVWLVLFLSKRANAI